MTVCNSVTSCRVFGITTMPPRTQGSIGFEKLFQHLNVLMPKDGYRAGLRQGVDPRMGIDEVTRITVPETILVTVLD